MKLNLFTWLVTSRIPTDQAISPSGDTRESHAGAHGFRPSEARKETPSAASVEWETLASSAQPRQSLPRYRVLSHAGWPCSGFAAALGDGGCGSGDQFFHFSSPLQGPSTHPRSQLRPLQLSIPQKPPPAFLEGHRVDLGYLPWVGSPHVQPCAGPCEKACERSLMEISRSWGSYCRQRGCDSSFLRILLELRHVHQLEGLLRQALRQ